MAAARRLFRPLFCRFFFTHSIQQQKRSVVPFDNPEVKSILKKITGRNLDKIYAPRKQALVPPSYKLLTDTEFLEAQQEIEKKAEHLLEMPVMMDEREEINEVLEENSELSHISQSNFVFTDISASQSDRTRSILVREPSGRLRKATWEERDRMTFVYFPKPGRKASMPELLMDDNLKVVFRQNRHEDVLDLACVQLEPDSADYIRVHQRTYQDISTTKKYNLLWSTRHFGGLVYYLAKNQTITGLLEYMVEQDLWEDCVQVVRLCHLLNPYSTLAEQANKNSSKGLAMLRAYIARNGSAALLQKVDNFYNLRSQRE